jgi:hypothetical protein
MNKFSTARDAILNSQYLALPTIMALKSSHNMRFAEESKIPCNHVTCCWQEQIIDYESKRTYPFSLPNLYFTCGDTPEFEGLASGYSLVPRPFMMLARHWPRSLVMKLCQLNSCFHDNWNQNDVYNKKVKIGKRKRKSQQSSSTDVGDENVTKFKVAEPSTEQIAHLRWLQQQFRNLYEDKGELLSIQHFFDRRIRSAKSLKLAKDEVEEAQMNQRDAISKQEVVIKNIESIQSKLETARGEMTGERAVSYTHDPIHWRTKPIQDTMRESKDEESESE